MASSKSEGKSDRSRSQDRSRVAGGQKHEVSYAAKKSGASASDVRKTVKSVGNSRKKVEKALTK